MTDTGDERRGETMGLEQRGRLREALDAVDALGESRRRYKVLTQLAIADSTLHPSRFEPDLDTFDILEACINADRGLIHLAQALKLVVGSTPECIAFAHVVDEVTTTAPENAVEIETLLIQPGHTELLSLLPQIPDVVHAKAVRDTRLGDSGGVIADAADAAATLSRLGQSDTDDRELIWFRYLELVGHQLEQTASDAMHRAVNEYLTAAPQLRGHVDEFCSGLAADPRPLRPAADSSELVVNHDKSPAVDGDSMITVTVRESEPATAARTVWGGVPPRYLNFTGRGLLLEYIRESLERLTKATLVPQALHGFGGVGKSLLANEYAYRYQEEYDLVWWIPSEDERSIRRSLVSLARRLRLPESADADDTIGAVLDTLRHGRPHRRWLLIFDNAGDPEELQRYRPVEGPGHVLVTSRSNKWIGQTEVVSVDVFTPAESVELLSKRWPALTTEEAAHLAERLGQLPLALEQAAAVHHQTGMTLREYLDALDDTPFDVLDEGRPAGYPLSLAQTFRVAYRELAEKNQAAAQLLALCGLMSSLPVAVEVLVRGRAAELPSPLSEVLRVDISRRKAVRDLGEHALAQLDPGRNLITIHNLVRDLLREQLSPQESADLQTAAHGVLALANPGDPDKPTNWPWLAQLNPHIEPSGIIESSDPEARAVVLDQIRYLYAIGDYSASQKMGDRVVREWQEMFGADDELTLVASRHLANSLRELGRYAEVREINIDTLERMRRVFPANHEHVLATVNSVAADLRLQGEFHAALELDTENLQACGEAMGENDVATQRAANNLAVDHRLLGNFTEALKLDEVNVALRANMFGEDHVRTLSSYTGLVRDYLGLGQYDRAFSLQTQKLRVHEQILPPFHAELMRAQRNLAILQRKNGQYGKALTSSRKVYEDYRTRLGETHEQTIAASLTLCNALRVNDELDEAIEVGREAHKAYESAFGPRHPMTLVSQVDVAIILRQQEDYDAAREVNDLALDGLRAVLGDDHPWTLCSLTERASLVTVNDASAALAFSEDVLDRSRRVRGFDHPYTLACAANYSLDLEANEDAVQASAVRRDTLERLRRILGKDHPETLSVGIEARVSCDIEPPPL
jgi:tetratricopeptide (TPR) repeat protein